MKKIFVLDTNIILNDHKNVLAFDGNIVVIPNVVTVEIDHKKGQSDEIGFHARRFSDFLDELRSLGKLKEGVPLENGGILKTVNAPRKSPVYKDLGEVTNDIRIIASALELQEQGYDVTLVSNDTNVRIMADEYVKAQKFLNDQVITSEDEGYKGYTSLTVEAEVVNELKNNFKVTVDSLKLDAKYPENHFFLLNGFLTTRLCGNFLIKTYPYKESVFGITPRNQQQEMSLNLLMDKNVPIVTLEGSAGSGKTLMALAAGLQQTLENKIYHKLIYMKPPIETEYELGFLPGELADKLLPHYQPAFDNLEVLFNCKTRKDLDKILQGYEGIINFEHIGHMRGRTIPNAYIIVDESQNLTKHGAKTLLTRLGEGSKIILMGDSKQIDNRFVDAFSNGLTHTIERLKETDIHGHVKLPKSERSTVAQICADLL